MGLSGGIVGLPNVGKSTIFNALCCANAAVENYPFTTIEPNTGIVAIPDNRLKTITKLSPSQKMVPAFLELVDIAGLVKGASKGEGLGNQFLGHIKNVDAIVHVVRCFENTDIVHVEGKINPVRDIELIETELLLSDLATLEKSISKLEKAAKSANKQAKEIFPVYQKVLNEISKGIPVRKMNLSKEELNAIVDLNLLTAKPVLYVANIDELSIKNKSVYQEQLESYALSNNCPVVFLCGKLEAEISNLPKEEQQEFLSACGLMESGLEALSKAIYKLLGLETFFTISQKENHAWTIKKGTTALKAAGIIHSDFEKGFIKAEVFTVSELEQYKSESALRLAGKIRFEGKDYIVKDGDIIFFRFNI